MPAQAYLSRRSLGDKLHLLAQLSAQDVRDLEVIVDYRIRTRITEEYDRIRAAAKPPPPPLPFRR